LSIEVLIPVERPGGAATLATPHMGVRRVLFAVAVAATTAHGLSTMSGIVSTGGTTRLELAILVLFVPTFAWISVAFWNAIVGFLLVVARRDPLTLGARVPVAGIRRTEPLGCRTALAIPARHEDVNALLVRVEKMLASLGRTGHAAAFDVHLLSDSSDPDAREGEARAWADLKAGYTGPVGLHYRYRTHNPGRKAGNVWEFLTRCRAWYRYAVVLDADSLMRGDTLVRLVRTMEANPEAGLMQTVPVPAPQPTRFGRFLGFAGEVYGPLLATGQAFWQGDAGNYWGHNAILRVDAFLEHARLPVLSGASPWGGEILSHDFVEAALLRRAGWGVYLLPGLDGSWEDVPQNLVDYARRDRRWAQGSLQHLRLVGVRGLHPLSRIHFMFGAMGYVSSALWLLLLMAGTTYVAGGIRIADPGLGSVARLGNALPFGGGGSLLAVTGALLFVPKLLGVVLAARAPDRFGGGWALVRTAGAGALFAVLVAPISMLFHARSVGEIVIGRSVAWGAQFREGRCVSWAEATRFAWWVTAVGLVWGGWTLALSPLFFAWMSPIFAGLLLAVPIVRWTSGPGRVATEPRERA